MESAPFNHAAALLACARGDEKAFHRLYDHEAPHMLALCQRLVPDDAEGLLHDTLALIWRNADQYDPQIGPARAWIYSVLRHLANSRRMRLNAVPPATPPALPPASAVRGQVARLAAGAQPGAYEAVAHAYLHGADYRRLAGWLRGSEADIRKTTRAGLKELLA